LLTDEDQLPRLLINDDAGIVGFTSGAKSAFWDCFVSTEVPLVFINLSCHHPPRVFLFSLTARDRFERRTIYYDIILITN